MSGYYQSLNQFDGMDFDADQKQLNEAFLNNDLEDFQLAMEMGADPMMPNDNGVCVYEMALSTYGRSEFVEECFNNYCSPHYVNQRLNKAAINYAADSKDPRIINLILRDSHAMVNYSFSGLTALNSLAVNVNDDNVDDVMKCMESLILYGASTTIADDSGLIPLSHLNRNAKLNEANKKKILEKLQSLEKLAGRNVSADKVIHEDSNEYEKFSHIGISSQLSSNIFPYEEENVYWNIDNDWQNKYLFFNSIKHKDHKTFDVIMTKGIDYNSNFESTRPLQCALTAGNCYALKRLLHQPDINIQLVECPLSQVVKNMKYDTVDYRKCFFMLLKNKHIVINETDASGSSALHYAVESRNNEVITELLKRGAFLGAKNNSNIMGIEGMCPALLQECFDGCISPNYSCGVSIKYDNLRSIASHADQYDHQKEMPTLTYMATSEEYSHLLDHPLITTFLNLKWRQLCPIFYINLLWFIFFAISVMTYTVLKFSGSEAEKVFVVFHIMSWIGIVYMILRESIQLATSPRHYICCAANYLELTLIVLAIINCTELDINRHTQKVIAVATLLLVAVELFLLCGCLPILSMSTHMLMLEEVCKSFLKSFLLYSIFVVTFSFCFYILFGTKEGNAVVDGNGHGDFNKFTNPLMSVIKTVVMLTGEFDADNIEFSSLYSYLLFLLFVLLMTIVLYNLLNGLAVSDIQTIMGQAEHNGLRCRIELLTRYEEIVLGHSVYRRFAHLYSVASQSYDIENAASKGRVPNMNRETLEIAMDILEKKRLASKRQQRLRNNENRFNNIENKLADIFKTLNSKC